MSIKPDISLADYRNEMQHRVVKYGPRSRGVREGLSFARRHEDPEFLRIAMDKVHAQQRYLREVFGPSRSERLLEVFNMGSMREVLATLALVVVGCLTLEASRSWMLGRDATQVPEADVERLAQRMGLYMTSDGKGEEGGPLSAQVTKKIHEGIQHLDLDRVLAQKLKAALETAQLDLSVDEAGADSRNQQVEQLLATAIEKLLSMPEMQHVVIRQIQSQLNTPVGQEALQQQIQGALAELPIDKSVTDHVDRRLGQLSQQVDAHLARMSEQMVAILKAARPETPAAPVSTPNLAGNVPTGQHSSSKNGP